MNNTDQRLQQINIATWIGIIANLCLAVSKVIAGFISGSLAVIGDGIDSTTDILSFIVILFATRIMSKHPDENHPYGHHRAEPLATIIIAFLIFFIGAQLLQASVSRLFNKEAADVPGAIAIYVTIISILGKVFLAFFQFRMGKKTHSSMLIANARNMLNDIYISTGVLLGLGLTFWLKSPYIDPIIAFLVSLWVIKTAVKIFLETNTELMEGIEDTSVYNKIFDAVKAVKGAYNPHRTRVRKLANLLVIDVDIEVDKDISVTESHIIAVEVEKKIKTAIDNVYDISVHVEPLGNEEKHEKFGVAMEPVEEAD